MERKFTAAGLLAGLVAGIVTFVYARIFIEPQVARAIDYEDVRSDAEAALTGQAEHEHEVFTRSVQENIGAGVGTVVFALAIGAFFAVAFTLAWAYVGRRRDDLDPRIVAVAVGAVGFIAVIGVPYFVYPPNPPAVGEEDTIGARSGAYLTLTVVSVVLAVAVAIAASRSARRIPPLWATLGAAVVYLVGVTVTALLLPDFREVPGPVMDGDRIVAPGFPGQVVADFRIYAVGGQVVLWTVLTVVFVAALTVLMRRAATRTEAPSARVDA
ncbi:CbtA family protein [Gordonia shandongensis]|uniref:CbtA family protein n=1 Tax=Gordonia shandongensis TaxID=376351 RepID=UPI0004159728|nr:CbtA family protein [Gordonia shandongensis]